nr:immunoglobulin heavy chain junction region [Macaca mulatta]
CTRAPLIQWVQLDYW